MPRWAKALGPHAERVANLLGSNIDGKYSATTRLTGTKQRAAQAMLKARRTQANEETGRARRQRPAVDAAAFPLGTCVGCGAPLERKRHIRCSTCWATHPGQAEITRRERGQAIAARRQELERWPSEHPDARTDPEAFRREILPGLAALKLADIQTATGCAKSTASMIRSGSRVPALRHWAALATLGQGAGREGV